MVSKATLLRQVVALAALLLLGGDTLAADRSAPALPAGLTCDDVRAKVAEIGRIRAITLAIANGATWAQIREARKCLR